MTMCHIRKIRRYLSEHSTQLLVQALVLSKLDYCNSLLAGLPACATRPLQRIQNAAARLVFNLPRCSHVTLLLISLHWLPITRLHQVSPPALHPHPPSTVFFWQPSGGPTAQELHKLFSCLAPQWWNQLPTSTTDTDCLPTFKKRLKKHLFREYNGT